MSTNARDLAQLERELTGHVHPKLIAALIKMSGDNHALKQQMMTLANMFDQLVEGQIKVANAAGAIGNKVSVLERARAVGMEVANDPTVTGESDELL